MTTTTSRKVLLSVGAALLLLAGCQNASVRQKSGTAWETDDDGTHRRPVTYVSPEEYERLTPAERQRLNATVGVEGTVSFTGTPAKPQDISRAELDRATQRND